MKTKQSLSALFLALAGLALAGPLPARAAEPGGAPAGGDERFGTVNVSRPGRVELGWLGSGADGGDLRDGAFDWDYVSYANCRWQLNGSDRLTLGHQYWKYLSANHLNYGEVQWRHALGESRAVRLALDYAEDGSGYRLGTVYLGYEGRLGPAGQWALQSGLGTDSESELRGAGEVELFQPLAGATLLRLGDSYYHSTSGFRSNAARVNLVQGLCPRLALNVGYRHYWTRAATRELEGTRSHELSSELAWSPGADLFLAATYARYENNLAVRADAFGLKTRWRLAERLTLTGGYRCQLFARGAENHGGRVGLAWEF